MAEQCDCRRCGTCCRKGGPSFHLEDKHLIDEGKIPAKYLFTIRRGEPVHENIHGRVAPVATDLIKIKGKPGGWACVFLEEESNRCGIYADRPAECRTLKCWDPQDIIGMYRQRRLSRQDLLQGVSALWEWVAAHEARCSYGIVFELAAAIRSGTPNAHDQLIEIIAFDREIRSMAIREGKLDENLIEFLFGRPFTVTLPPVLNTILPGRTLICP